MPRYELLLVPCPSNCFKICTSVKCNLNSHCLTLLHVFKVWFLRVLHTIPSKLKSDFQLNSHNDFASNKFHVPRVASNECTSAKHIDFTCMLSDLGYCMCCRHSLKQLICPISKWLFHVQAIMNVIPSLSIFKII